MPSEAFATFNTNIGQVDRLLQAFHDMRQPTPGKKALDHFTRAAVLFLCSSWEVYVEDVVVEACNKISEKLNTPEDLPKQVKKNLSDEIRKSRNDLEPIIFGKDWKSYYRQLASKRVNWLNTPKKENVVDILYDFTGADKSDIESQIPTLKEIDMIVKVRGEIAHNIYSDGYVHEHIVNGYRRTVNALVVEVEKFLWEYLKTVTGIRPWQNTYK